MKKSNKQIKSIELLKKDLDKALKKGWKAFPKHKDYAILKAYADHLRETGYFDSRFRKKIPHPAHHYSAMIVGVYALKLLLKRGVQLDQIFPGDFSLSTGTDVEDKKIGQYENRNFHMHAWKNGKRLCEITFSFPHFHDKFDFPKPPFVTIGKRQ